MGSNKGFTLIELLTIVILVSILSVFALPRFTNSDLSDVQASRDSLVAALQLTRQLALARDSAANPIAITTTSTTITVLENTQPITFAGLAYPLTLPTGVSLSPATTLAYDKLGATGATVFTLSKGTASATVNLSATGYAR